MEPMTARTSSFADLALEVCGGDGGTGGREPNFFAPSINSGFGAAGMSPTTATRDLQGLEERLQRQVLRAQQASERIVDAALRPLEAKVSLVENRQPAIDLQVAEFGGIVRGLQTTTDTHSKRIEAMEQRFRKWRKAVEDDVIKKHQEMKSALSSAIGGGNPQNGPVTRGELLDIVDLLKDEIRNSVASELRQEPYATRHELEVVVSEVASTQNGARQELREIAISLQEELIRLAEQKAADAKSMCSLEALQQVERAVEAHRRLADDLATKARRNEMGVEEMRRNIQRVQEDIQSVKALELRLDFATRSDVERIAEEVADRIVAERQVAAEVAALTARAHAEERSAAEDLRRTDEVALELEAVVLRVEAMEQRQRTLRQELDNSDLIGRLDKTWHVVEEDRARCTELQRCVERLVEKIAATEENVSAQRRRLEIAEADGGKTSGAQGFSEASEIAERLASRLSSARASADVIPEGGAYLGGIGRGSFPLMAQYGAMQQKEVTEMKAEISEIWHAIAELADQVDVELTCLGGRCEAIPLRPEAE